MTKVQNPIIGRAKGSAGGMTFSKNSDQNVMRAKAFEVNNPKTTAQTTQRDYFKSLAALVSTFSPEQLRTLFPNKPKKMSRRNALARQLAEDYTIAGTTKSIDFAEINTLGNASTMDFGEITTDVDEQNLIVRLSSTVTNDVTLNSFRFVCVLVNETKKEMIFPINCALVEDNDYQIVLPTNWEETDIMHAIPLITDRKTPVNNTGFGSFIIKTRPEKKGRNIGQ